MNKMQTDPITAAETTRAEGGNRTWMRTVVMLIVPALLLIGGGYYWLTSGGSVSTDDAQVRQDIVSVSPQVNGQIVQVFVRNGSQVKRGDILWRIDAQPYRVALEQAQAQLANARLQTHVLRTTAAGTSGDITGAEANLAIKQNALGRQQALLKKGFTTRADYEDALNDVRTAETELADAQARAANASAAVAPGEQPQIAQAQAAVDKAKLDLERTAIHAPMDGIIENADKLQVGQMAVLGVGMLSASSTARAPGSKPTSRRRTLAGWCLASARRSRSMLTRARSSRRMWRASAPEPAASSRCFPPQNANGNWVKVTQRVPVRIAFNGNPSKPMIAGLSTTATVYFDQKK